MQYQDIRLETSDGVATLTIDRQANGNRFTRHTALEMADALRRFRDDPAAQVGVITGAGDKFFCIGGEHEPVTDYGQHNVMPIIDVYELIDATPKPVIAAVNGFAVGGGHVLHVVCDLTIAAEHAVFRQVGPMVGSFDPGFGTWYLEEAVGRKRAKEIWYLNRKYTAAQALEMGLVNEVVPGAELMGRVREVAEELMARSPMALAALKGAFSARHTGVLGQARVAHDQMLTLYLATQEAQEMGAAFGERRRPDPERFYR